MELLVFILLDQEGKALSTSVKITQSCSTADWFYPVKYQSVQNIILQYIFLYLLMLLLQG